MTKQERETRRNQQIKEDKGYAIMVPNWVVRDYSKLIKDIFGEEVTLQDISNKLEELDWFGSGLRSISFESEVDGNGYFFTIRIFRDIDGGDKLNILERGCISLNGRRFIHPDKGYTILKEKTFESDEELALILNSPIVKRKVGNEVFTKISIWVDDHSYEYIIKNKL